MPKRKVMIGFLGSQLDSGQGAGRWEKWRPTVSIAQHEDLLVDRIELLHAPAHVGLAEQVSRDIGSVSPHTEVHRTPMSVRDPWDFGEVYGALYDWVRTYD